MTTRNVKLTEHLDQFIEAGVASGRFSDASEVVREGLRLLEQREQEDRARVSWLRGAARDGFDELDRGEGIEFASTIELGSYIDAIGEAVSAEVNADGV